MSALSSQVGRSISPGPQLAAHVRATPSGSWLMLGTVWFVLTARLYISYKLTTPLGVTWGMADDAYITADFARTFAQGEGPRWYPDAPKVEGFSSPLWLVAMAALHFVPGFSENSLGLFVLGLNLLILLGCAWALVRALELTVAFGTESSSAPRPWFGAWLPLGLATISLCSWTSRGFEVALVLLLSLLAYVEVLRPERFRAWLVGAWIGLAIWARLDAVLYCIPAGVALLVRTLRARDFRGLLVAGATSGALVLLLFVSRRLYFGDWLPNTYYLKATDWPLSNRVPRGVDQNAMAIVTAVVGLPPVWFLLLRNGSARAWIGFGATLSYVAVLAYSTCLSGDFSFESFGYDRFTAIALVFLVLGLCVFVQVISKSRAATAISFAWCLAIVALPVLLRPPVIGAQKALLKKPRKFFARRDLPWAAFGSAREDLHPRDNFAQLFVYYGKVLRMVSRPGATVALCPAGAPVYFSHRGGVDLLGKVDPAVARLRATTRRPRESRCWQDRVGHNKEDVAMSFRLRKPDLSLVEPPAVELPQYIRFRYLEVDFWARRGSPHVLWKLALAHLSS